jgi:hypothetical protein
MVLSIDDECRHELLKAIGEAVPSSLGLCRSAVASTTAARVTAPFSAPAACHQRTHTPWSPGVLLGFCVPTGRSQMEIAAEVPARHLGGVNVNRCVAAGLPPGEHGYPGFAARANGFENGVKAARFSRVSL